MIITSEKITKFTLDAKETRTLCTILNLFAEICEDRQIPITVNFARKMSDIIKKVEAAE